MLTTLPISLPLLLVGATFPRTRWGAMCWRGGDKLLSGWPIDGVTADDQRRKAGLPVESDKILWPGAVTAPASERSPIVGEK
jgi:hypothetical protein